MRPAPPWWGSPAAEAVTATSADIRTAAAPPPGGGLEIRIRSDLTEVGRASAWLGERMAALDLPHELRYRLDTVLAEAVTNVISHGYRDAGPHEVTVRFAREGNGWAIEVEDDGVAFNPLEAAPPRTPGSHSEASVGGLGIHLIRSFADECRYRRENDRNRLTMVARPRPPGDRPV